MSLTIIFTFVSTARVSVGLALFCIFMQNSLVDQTSNVLTRRCFLSSAIVIHVFAESQPVDMTLLL